MTALLAYGAYVPAHRLARADIGATLGGSSGRGTRAVAAYDEDETSLAVEAARAVLRSGSPRPYRLYFACTALPYLDKTNAAVIHAALGLDRAALAVDMGGAPRSGVGALMAAVDASAPTLALLSDIRTGLPGSADERDGGDAAAGLLFGPPTADHPALARVIGVAATTEEVLERWRSPGAPHSRVWEERFSEHVYAPLAEEAFAAALKAADRTPEQVDRLVVCGLAQRAVKAFARRSGVPDGALTADLAETLGNAGAAQLGLLLAAALDNAAPKETIALVHLADGATAIVLETTEHLPTRRQQRSIAAQAGAGRPVSYSTFLTWRGMLNREPPRRPEPDPPAAPPMLRSSGFKLGFQGSACDSCGTVNVPPARVCFSCGEVDRMSPRPLRETPATVATYTVDRLAFTPNPPMVAVVIDFDGGGRFRCELADAAPADVGVGTRVELTFRRLLSADGVHNYFWKARPVPVADVGPAGMN